MKAEYIYDGEWGVTYDPIKKTMIAGYSMDGETFTPEFVITELEEDDLVDDSLTCSIMYASYGVIVASYKKLLEEYESPRQ